MKKTLSLSLAGLILPLLIHAVEPLPPAAAKPKLSEPPPGELLLREIRYDGKLADSEARFIVDVSAEATGKTPGSVALFEGDVALLPAKLPEQLAIIRDGNRYTLNAAGPGRFNFRLELVAKIQRAEPWNQISFTGPVAAIASITAQAAGAGMEVQLQSGTLVESAQTNGVSRVRGLLGADRAVSLRWQGKITEVARKALITADTSAIAHVTPTVIKYTTAIRYDIMQGNAPRLTLTLPAAHALTRLVGEQIRDWQLKPDGDKQVLTIEFIKPVERRYELTLFSEQALDNSTTPVALNPPQPSDVERESGSFTVSAEDMVAETDALAGLRQVNATGGALAAYRFNARPFTLAFRLKRIEPVISVGDRVTARLEETRLLISHSLTLNVEKAGIYALDLTPQPGFAVAEVRGDGVEDWKMNDGKLRVNFSSRVLGSRKLDVQLEQPLKSFPEQITVAALRVNGAAKETAQVGAASAPGIRVKTGELVSLREQPVNNLPGRTDELLAFNAESPDWKLTLACERLAPRIVADVFNLVTVGNGLVGGSATIRYGIVNQGVQEFRVKVPAHCRNVEFTGPDIRRREFKDGVWTIGLQDKAWGGYTLVVTYDHQFDPNSADARAHGATLPVGGIHALDVERETGSVAITAAASLKLNARTAGDSLRRVDESELSAADRALITRAIVLAYQYAGGGYDLTVDVQRHDELPVLEAVADRTQITSVLTEAGEMLTQASFMVKNNAKQFQRFQLPGGADFWGCYVNGQPAKPERDGDWVLVPLPRDANRDQAFAVDIVYAQTNGASRVRSSGTLTLSAPRTDVPNTYAEWQLYAPATKRLSNFGGSMMIAEGTTYGLLDAWEKFLAFYMQVLREAGAAIFVIGLLAVLVIGVVIMGARRGASGIIELLVVVAILAILSAMLLPALSKAKMRAQRISSMSNLKQVGLAAQMFAGENDGRLPGSFDEMMNELNTDKVTYDPETGQRYVYLGAGFSISEITPDSVIAYSGIANGRCNVLFADGSVQSMTSAQFGETSQRGLIRRLPGEEIARRQQVEAISRSQLPAAAATPVVISGSTTADAPLPAKLVKGLRSIRIEIPREGNSFTFTKILNIRDEPLSVSAHMMSLETFRRRQMLGQAGAFLVGLAAWLWQWRRTQRNSFILTCALMLVIVAVGSLLVAWRALHDALIVGLPAVVLAIIAWLVWRRVRRQKARAEADATSPELGGSTPPVMASLLIGGFLACSTAAQAVEATNGNPSAIVNKTTAVSSVSVLSANYTGTVNDRVALVDATLQLSSSKPGQTLALFGEDVAIQQFTVKNGEAKLVREGGNVSVRLAKRGDATLQIKLVARIGGDVTKRRLAFTIPFALSSQVALTLDQAEADVDFPTAISFKRVTSGDKTRVDAIIGSGERVELLWTPRVKRAAEVAATVFCQNTSLVTMGGGVMNARSVLDYQVTQGELRTVRVRLPSGQRLLRVEGESLRTWEVKDESGAQTLVVELLKGISPSYRLTVETEKAVEAMPVTVNVETPHALEVKRETGLVALRGAEEVMLNIEGAKELQRVDAEEFARSNAGKADGLVSAFRFLKPEYELRARVETVQPQIEAVVRNSVRVNSDWASISATVDYNIKRAGVFVLKLALPQVYRLDGVHGDNVQQWVERTGANGRVLEVTLKQRATGNFNMRIEMSKIFGVLPKPLEVVGVHPLDTAKLTGFVSVIPNPGVAVKTAGFDGLTEIPVVALPDGASLASMGGVLAYKFIATEPQAAQPWKLSVNTESVEAWVRAEIVNTFTVSETLVSGRALVRYDIANAPVSELRVKAPASFKNLEITGANIRRTDQTGDEWRVTLQSRVRGNYTLTVTWEQPRASKTNAVALAGISAAGVERETGLLAVIAKPPLQVMESRAADVTRVDAREFPEWAGKADEATVLAYRYVRPGYKLALEARRFDEASVLQALVDSVRLTTVVADDGQAMTEMAMTVRNNGRQFLEVELPPGAEVWSAFVAGQPVRPTRRAGKLLLPLQEWGADAESVSVELTYAGTNLFPRIRGGLNFVSPKLDAPFKNAHWELFLPPDYDYDRFAGTMAREVAAKPSVLSFGLSEYVAKEKQNKAAWKEEAKKDVSKAQSNLSTGNVRDAVANYNRARWNYYANDAEGGDQVRQLEKDVRNAQAGNLIQAQQAFSFENNGKVAGQRIAGAGGGANNSPVDSFGLRYDNAAAEAQWTKLAAAQEVAAEKVQPLRVNLPLRGLRHSFAQVLQTEINKPMTVQFSAVNVKAGNRLTRLGMGLAGFLVLWGVVKLVSSRKHSSGMAAA